MDEMSEVIPQPKVDRKHPIRSKLAAGLMAVGLGTGLAGSSRAIENYYVPPHSNSKYVDVADFLSGISFPILPEIVTEVTSMDPDKPVSDDVLRTRYHTFIHDLPDVKLEIMPEALMHEPAFSRIRSKRNSELHIVFLNAPYVDAAHIPKDIDDQALRQVLEDDMKRDISEKQEGHLFSSLFVTKWKEIVEKNRLPGGKFGELSIIQTEELEVTIDNLVKLLVSEPNLDELAKETAPLGKVVETISIEGNQKIRRTYVLVSARLRPMTRKEVAMSKIGDLVHASRETTLLKAFDSFMSGKAKRDNRLVTDIPDPRDLPVNVDEDVYPILRLDLGATLRHEFKHAGGLQHPDTDLAVLKDLYDASRRYQAGEAWDPTASDARGYYFRITTPDGEFNTRRREDDVKERLRRLS